MKKFITLLLLCSCNYPVNIQDTCGTVSQIQGTSFQVVFQHHSYKETINRWYHTDRPDTIFIGQKICLK